MPILRAVAVSIVRALVALGLAWFVQRQMLDHSLAEEAAGVIAFLLVDRIWEFHQRHREEVARALYQRWLVTLGLRAEPYVQPSTIVHAAKERVRVGMQP